MFFKDWFIGFDGVDFHRIQDSIIIIIFFNLKGCLVGLLKGTSMNNGLNMVSKKGFNLMGF
jgi:hypothetical protein